MATETITGKLTDFGLDDLSPYNATVTFTPSSAATTTDGHLLSARPITVTPDSIGDFTVDLVSGETTMPAVYYLVTITYLAAISGGPGKDFPAWKLWVPVGGGAIGDIGWAPSNPALAYIDVEAPPGDNFTEGTWWLDADLADPINPDASGILYEWTT